MEQVNQNSEKLRHQKYMAITNDLAQKCPADEVPVAAIIVDLSTDEIIAQASNQRETKQSILAHAEILALEEAAQKKASWNLSDCALYVNLEPCAMCTGAILQAHIKEVIYGLPDTKSGALGSRHNLATKKLTVVSGILEDESRELLSKFFEARR